MELFGARPVGFNSETRANPFLTAPIVAATGHRVELSSPLLVGARGVGATKDGMPRDAT